MSRLGFAGQVEGEDTVASEVPGPRLTACEYSLIEGPRRETEHNMDQSTKHGQLCAYEPDGGQRLVGKISYNIAAGFGGLRIAGLQAAYSPDRPIAAARGNADPCGDLLRFAGS